MSLDDKVEEEYDERFTWREREYLTEKKIAPEIANKYDKRFNYLDIATLLGVNDNWFSHYKWIRCSEIPLDFARLLRAKCPPEQANKYNKRFYGVEIAALLKAKCSPEKADEYPKRFNGWDIADLVEANVLPEQSDKYDKRFKGHEIAELFKANILPEKTDKYDERFSGLDIFYLIEAGCPPKHATEYDEKFTGFDISNLIKAKCTSRQAHQYDKQFSGREIAVLFKASCLPEQANKYYEKFSGWEIAILYTIGLTPDKLDKEKQKNLHALLDKIINREDITKCPESHILIGTGASGIVLLKDRSYSQFGGKLTKEFIPENAWKFSLNILHEYSLLDKIRNKYQKQGNVIRVIGKPQQDIALEIKYIKGNTLEKIIQKKPIPQKAFKYSYNILNGLIQMRLSDVYHHRDLRPANIMIDEMKDYAVIIDLGLASTDKHALSEDNRRYGSPTGKQANDLIALGQVIYSMTVGRKLFAKSKSMELSVYASEIRDNRDEVYANPRRLRYYLRKVDKNVKDDNLAQLIKTCLTAKHYQYGKVKRMFERYLR